MEIAILLLLFLAFKKAGGTTGGGTTGTGGGGLAQPKAPPLPPTKVGVIPQLAPAGGLSISPDCKSVAVTSAWFTDKAAPRLAEFVAMGGARPLYTEANTNQSLDGAIRTVVAESAGVACINDAPWLDRYVKAHPLPKPIAGESLAEFRARLKTWDNAWDSLISSWAASHPQLFGLFKQLGAIAYNGYATGQGIDLDRVPDTIESIKNATAADVATFKTLGYDIYGFTVEQFQGDYNQLKNFQTDFGWTTFGFDLDVDNKIGPFTRAAMQDALGMAGNPNGWRVLVASAQ